MAIFHFHESNISRSDGRSAVACAAYRACEKLEDLTYGKTQDYTRKKGLEYKNIYAPEHANEELLDRQILWNTVEKKEFNADGSMKAKARLAKEYECALPHELTDQERIQIVDEFCQDIVKKHNVIVDACIHAPHQHSNGSHNKNYHVHIMFTTRVVNDKGELGKKQRTFNDHGPEILKDSRATFASVVNTVLENAGLDERIDHRSYKDQGKDFEPTKHEGVAVTQMRRRYQEEQKKPFNDRNQEIILPQLAKENDEIRLRNLELEIITTENLIKSLKKESKTSFEDVLSTQNKDVFSGDFDQLVQKNRSKEHEIDIFARLETSISQLGKSELFSQLNSSISSQAEAEAKRQAEAEAKRQAEAEAKRQAEAEAKRQAEAEAKRQAEAEAKRQAEAEAKRQAIWLAPKPRGDDFTPF